eukprot:249521-Hanusia_phi.AAC.2
MRACTGNGAGGIGCCWGIAGRPATRGSTFIGLCTMPGIGLCCCSTSCHKRALSTMRAKTGRGGFAGCGGGAGGWMGGAERGIPPNISSLSCRKHKVEILQSATSDLHSKEFATQLRVLRHQLLGLDRCTSFYNERSETNLPV